MRFGVRNAYYLRISANAVLPLYVYLDERHVDWMSERILQHVLEDLRPLIPFKLQSEADVVSGGPSNAKKGSLDVHRGEGYQFGYFLRKAEPHAVILKTRYFVADPYPPQRRAHVPLPPPEDAPQKRSRKRKAEMLPSTDKKRSRAKGKSKAKAVDEALDISSDEDEAETNVDSIAPAAPRRSNRARKLVAGGYRDPEGDDSMEVEPPDPESGPAISSSLTTPEPNVESGALDDPGLIALNDTEDPDPLTVVKDEDTEIELQATEDTSTAQGPNTEVIDIPSDPITQPEAEVGDEEEDVKPKPLLQLRYRGLNVNDRCLCVILEPYPPLPMSQRGPSVAPAEVRAPSIAPPDFVPSSRGAQQSRMPLFLPDLDRGETPAPFPLRASVPPVPLFNHDALEYMDEDDEDGLLAFSQVLRSVGDHTAGAVEDDDEIDGAVFFGDADENKELS